MSVTSIWKNDRALKDEGNNDNVSCAVTILEATEVNDFQFSRTVEKPLHSAQWVFNGKSFENV